MGTAPKTNVLLLGCEDGVLRALVSRADVTLWWADTPREAKAVIEAETIDVCIVTSDFDEGVVAAARSAHIPTIVRSVDGHETRRAEWTGLGAYVISSRFSQHAMMTISDLTGLAFAECPRVPFDQVVDVAIAGERQFLRSSDISLTGMSVLDVPEGSVGSAITVGFETDEGPLVLSATVARLFNFDGRPAAGLQFRGVVPQERAALHRIVENGLEKITIPTDEKNVPTPTADLAISPSSIDKATLRAALSGAGAATPWWLDQVVRTLTRAEIETIDGGGPAWAAHALEGRLCIWGLRAQAGSQNLTRTHFLLVRDICRGLSARGEGLPNAELVQITACRAAILRGLFGTELVAQMAAQTSFSSDRSSGTDEVKSRDWSQRAAAERTRSRAHELIASGKVRDAAGLFAEADMLDEAIHLYRNVLGSPADAAPLAEKRFGLEIAAQLYELGDRPEQAACLWSRLARRAANPERYFSRIDAASPDILMDLLARLVGERPLSQATVPIHYQYATLWQRTGRTEVALETFRSIRKTVGSYRDIDERIASLAEGRPEIMSSIDLDFDIGAEPLSTNDISLGEDEVYETVSTVDICSVRTPEPDEAAVIIADASAGVTISVDSPVADLVGDFVHDRAEHERATIWLADANRERAVWSEALQVLLHAEERHPESREIERRIAAVLAWRKDVADRMPEVGVEGVAENRGRYILRGEFKRGPRAVVYRARDRRLERDVALKVFSATARAALGDNRRVFRRLTVAASIHHPNVAAIHDFGELGDKLYVASEVLEREDVDFLRSTPTLLEALCLAEQLSNAVQAIHERGLVHGAITSNNVLLGPMGVAKLVDFARVPSQSTASPDIKGIGAWWRQTLGPNATHEWIDAVLGRTMFPGRSGHFTSAAELRGVLQVMQERLRIVQTQSQRSDDHVRAKPEQDGALRLV